MKWRAFLANLDRELLLLVLAIAAIGVINLFSAAQSTRPGLQYLQMAYVGIGLVLAVAMTALGIDRFERAAYPIYLVVCTLLILVLVMGTTIKGAQRWLNLGFFNLQPSELMKLAIVFAMARYLSRNIDVEAMTLRDILRPLNPSRPVVLLILLVLKWSDLGLLIASPWNHLMRALLLIAALLWLLFALYQAAQRQWIARLWIAPVDMLVPALLILIEPDLGTTLIVLAIAGTLILMVGMRLRSLGLTAIFGVLGAVVAWFKVLKPYQQQRIKTFLNPDADALGAGYHANQSMIAIGSGGLRGKGFMHGTQTQLSFLPENHTDFAFSVLAEEWGLLGLAVLLMLFLALMLKGLRIAAEASDRFSALAAVGATAVIFWQMLVNVGMVTGLMPVVGVTLPLVSYGGSSVLTVMTSVGVLLAVSYKSSVPHA